MAEVAVAAVEAVEEAAVEVVVVSLPFLSSLTFPSDNMLNISLT